MQRRISKRGFNPVVERIKSKNFNMSPSPNSTQMYKAKFGNSLLDPKAQMTQKTNQLEFKTQSPLGMKKISMANLTSKQSASDTERISRKEFNASRK